MHSLTFDDVNMTAYGLIVSSLKLPFLHAASPVQLRDRAFAYDSYKPPLSISADVKVTALSHVNLRSQLDSIRRIFNKQTDKKLIFHALGDRYWMARFESLNGAFVAPIMWEGDLAFACYNPAAYSTIEISNNYAINADPKTVTETTGGTAFISPVYTLTAGANFTPATIKVKNNDTAEELTWVGNVVSGKKLEIDVEFWVVKYDGVVSMATVSGQFPRLKPAQANSIKITGFGTSGALNIKYRNRFV